MKTTDQPEFTINGQRLRSHRKAQGLSQGALSRASGVSRSYITEIERGVKTPSKRVAWVLAHTLEIEIDDLIS